MSSATTVALVLPLHKIRCMFIQPPFGDPQGDTTAQRQSCCVGLPRSCGAGTISSHLQHEGQQTRHRTYLHYQLRSSNKWPRSSSRDSEPAMQNFRTFSKWNAAIFCEFSAVTNIWCAARPSYVIKCSFHLTEEVQILLGAVLLTVQNSSAVSSAFTKITRSFSWQCQRGNNLTTCLLLRM